MSDLRNSIHGDTPDTHVLQSGMQPADTEARPSDEALRGLWGGLPSTDSCRSGAPAVLFKDLCGIGGNRQTSAAHLSVLRRRVFLKKTFGAATVLLRKVFCKSALEMHGGLGMAPPNGLGLDGQCPVPPSPKTPSGGGRLFRLILGRRGFQRGWSRWLRPPCVTLCDPL